MKLKDTISYKKQQIKESTAPGFANRKFGDKLPTLSSIQKEYNKKGKKINEEYIEIMDAPRMANALGEIKEIWDDWKNGPATERQHIRPAQKELNGWIMRWMKQNIK